MYTHVNYLVYICTHTAKLNAPVFQINTDITSMALTDVLKYKEL